MKTARLRLILPLLAAACVLAVISAFIAIRNPKVMAATPTEPAYDKNGEMLPPSNYREWIYLTSGMDMNYKPESADMQGESTFDNVFVNPEAYRSFLSTGTWPDKTIIVMESRRALTKGSINQHGHFQNGAAMGLEVHLKDGVRFPGKWAFFSFDSVKENGTLIPPGAPCYACHADHAAVDTTFVQFYPTLLPVATSKETLSPSYLKDENKRVTAQ